MAMKTAKKYNPDLILHGNLIRAILSLAIPVVINSFLQTMYNLTDCLLYTSPSPRDCS